MHFSYTLHKHLSHLHLFLSSTTSRTSFREQGVKTEAAEQEKQKVTQKEEFLCFHALQKLLIQGLWAGEPREAKGTVYLQAQEF